jgi:HD superfamily phosphohydrolase
MSYRTLTADDITDRSILLENAKNIYVPIHDNVTVSLMATLFIDTKLFQRLSKLKQLATCNSVYPSAVHTRFEHSIGTYYLAGKLVERIKFLYDTDKCDNMSEWLNNIPELYNNNDNKIDDNVVFSPWIMELIKISALMHDVGHGPYSHLFDDIFIKDSALNEHIMAVHETRSCKIVEHIVKNNDILSKFITDNDIKFIQNVIDPPKSCNGFVYQIVSNSFNSLDVDKYDYLRRDMYHIGLPEMFNHMRLIENIMVIDNRIVYPDKSKGDIYQMFQARHYMHRIAYSHKGVVASQFIIAEIMSLIDRVINISESILDLDTFSKMTDDYIIQEAMRISEKRDEYSELYSDTELDQLTELLDRLTTHDLYTHIGTFMTKNNPYSKPFKLRFSSDEYRLYNNKIGFVSGNKGNPLDSIYVYKNKDILNSLIHNDHDTKPTVSLIDKTDITNLMPEIHQEYILSIYKVNRDNIAQDVSDFNEIMSDIKSHFNV